MIISLSLQKIFPLIENQIWKPRIYPAKVLLIGEYAVLYGGTALGLPYSLFSAKWEKKDTADPQLGLFLEFLKEDFEISKLLNLELLGKDLAEGVYLDSNIPASSGLGSSGSVVAAIWDRYAFHKQHPKLREIFSGMEGYFHGNSSGLDPLIIYHQKPILLSNEGMSLISSEIAFKTKYYKISLIDSGQKRDTHLWVKIFKKKMENRDFKNAFHSDFLSFNQQIITTFLNGEQDKIFPLWKSISQFQLQHMPEFIPEHLKSNWLTEHTAYKLCGAGGGGYFLKMGL
ncbi:MAG: hypothetical protein IPM48_02525 [Saprospiraceae bacterium]|nr:hypothetical protein [Saprospiraceae bacterium]